MRLWWRPGLPRLTEEGSLLVPDEGPEARRRQILAIWDDLQANEQEKEKKRAASDDADDESVFSEKPKRRRLEKLRGSVLRRHFHERVYDLVALAQ